MEIFTSLNELRSPEGYVPIEKVAGKINGRTWVFHKNDADTWPSELHGHCKERPRLVLDAITGEIFNKTTKYTEWRLTKKEHKRIKKILLNSDDFRDKAIRLFSAE